jgi:hypothetical protein
MSNYKNFLQDCDSVSKESSSATESIEKEENNENEQPPLEAKVLHKITKKYFFYNFFIVFIFLGHLSR